MATTKSNGRSTWAQETTTGRRRNLTYEEDEAFWAFAAIEVLRLTGIRGEELLELTHHSITEYRLPSTGELVPLLQIAPSKTDTERLLLVSPELADVLSAIVTRLREPGGAIPLVAAYDVRERVWNPAMPLLFQRSVGSEHRAITPTALRKLLLNALAETPGQRRRMVKLDDLLTYRAKRREQQYRALLETSNDYDEFDEDPESLAEQLRAIRAEVAAERAAGRRSD